jgi:tRNA A58 N-methylase Trm61
MKMNPSPGRMDNLSKTIFKDIYPLIASQIVERCRIKKGVCIDIGSGPGALAIALAKTTDLKIYSRDISTEMHVIAKQNVENEGLSHRIFPLIADVHQLPFDESSNNSSKSSDHAKFPKISVDKLKNDLNSAEIKNYHVINDDSGLWVIIKN